MRLIRFLNRTITQNFKYSTVKIRGPPQPLPLQNHKDQKEMEQLIERGGTHKSHTKLKNDFEGEVNPRTGEIGGPKGKEPTRFGDWEKNGRISDF